MQQTPFRIITIQDDTQDSRLLSRIFARDEFDVINFETPRELIQYMRIQPVPHCVITDLTIKDSSGVELIEKIRQKNNGNWMEILKIAFKHSPQTTAKVMQNIYIFMLS